MTRAWAGSLQTAPGRVALLSVTGLAFSLVLSLVRLLPGLVGFGVFLGSLLLGLLSLAWAIIRATRQRSLRAVSIPLIYGVLLVIAVAPLLNSARGYPRVNDVTTSPEDPPEFVENALASANRDRDMSYPKAFASLQATAYPDLRPVRVRGTLSGVRQRVSAAAEELGWQLVEDQPREDQLEATQVSTVFGFTDDIVVRLRPSADWVRVDVRSKSRVGKADFGVNAARIRSLAGLLDE